MGLRDVFLQPEHEGGTPLGRWPDLRVAVDLLPLTEARETDLNATVVGRSVGGVGSVAHESLGQDAASMVAALAYEMLGGTAAPSAGYYVPLPELSEGANRTLRRVFEEGGGGLTASALIDRLLGKAVIPPERSAATDGAALVRPGSPAAPVTRPPDAGALPRAPQKRPMGVWVTAGIVVASAAVAGIGLGLYFAGGSADRPRSAAPPPSMPAPVATPVPVPPAPAPPPAVVEPSPERKQDARELYLQALGLMNTGVAQDAAEAARLFRMAAEQGNADAQFQLGYLYENGRGVSRDEAESAKWYRKAAEQGNSSAQQNLERLLAAWTSGRGPTEEPMPVQFGSSAQSDKIGGRSTTSTGTEGDISPQQVLLDYYNCINEGHFEKAWNMLPANLQNNKKIHPDGYRSFRDWFEQLAPITVTDIQFVDQQSNQATIDLSYQSSVGGKTTSTTLRYLLERSDFEPQWAIQSVKVAPSRAVEALDPEVNSSKVSNAAVCSISDVKSYWNHNGSVVGLIVDGNKRTFVYVRPRKGLEEIVGEGTVLFEGVSDNVTYRGVARRFAKGEPPNLYEVSGPIRNNGSRVTLTGLVRLRNSTENVIKDSLDFYLLH